MVAVLSLLALPLAAAAPAGRPAATRPASRPVLTNADAAVVTVPHHDPAAALTFGAADAPVTVTLFLQLTGTNNEIALRTLDWIRGFSNDHPKRMRIVVVTVPPTFDRLTFVIAAREALAQGGLPQFFTGLGSQTRPTEEALLTVASDVGLNPAGFRQAWRQHRFDDAIRADYQQWRRYFPNSGATLSAVVGEFTLDMGAKPSQDRLWPLVETTYQRVRDWQARGVPANITQAGLQIRQATKAHPLTIPLPRSRNSERGKLLALPVNLAELPTLGSRTADIPLVVLCDLASPACASQLQFAAEVQKRYSDRVRVVWVPLFTPQLIANATLADAALCAHSFGSGLEWLNEQAARSARTMFRAAGNDGVAEVDAVAAALGIDAGKLAHCRAVMAGTATQISLDLHRQGMMTSPSIIIGGRVVVGVGLRPSDLDALVREQLETGWLDALRPSWAHSAQR